ncbi:TIGR04222 domain-containing membrane protein [Streptoalloteichus hindustanus]|uniref:TIGR04222 domain-containing protein n=1 Tax=Streptoalloteichus hindustanus TaxID=2017 RepID=A0A1M5H549_STRHI|nr:TIGR04222 domain-containing membrane protein [Streptoalloteichus hindustanus]SHG11130.1 TIGR04222 domain-containing protein [Streptoalloteichus hindustanus]
MNEPWGLSGPEFLLVYVVALGLAAVWLVAARHRMRVADGRPRTLSSEELAYLAGGPSRLADLAVGRLVTSGALRVSRGGGLRATGVPASWVIDADLLSLVAVGRALTVSQLRAAARTLPAVEEIERRLVASGAVVDPEHARAGATRAVLPAALVGVVGVLRLVNGIELNRPVLWLSLLLALTALVVVLGLVRPHPLRTTFGDQLVATARARRYSQVPTAELPMMLALVGITAMPPGPERAALLSGERSSSDGGGGSSASGGDGGSGGGSDGGSGGGGGGGCGGGGCGG